MKYGDNLTKVSVQKWNIHNVDYNSLKTAIKINTKRDEAKTKAMAIPGQPDTTLAGFESELFEHLCLEHQRVSLFVYTKSHEISRHLRHLSEQIHRLALRCSESSRASPKRYSKLLRYEQDLLGVGEDINNLPRFVHAQAEALRKITKKYRKWTGSSSLGERFRFNILDDPKSFTHLDFTHLGAQFENLLGMLRAIAPQANFPSTSTHPNPTPPRRPSTVGSEIPQIRRNASPGYWNEYEHGSEAGDASDDYVIYVVHTDEDPGFLSENLTAALAKPFTALKALFSSRSIPRDDEAIRAPLLTGEARSSSYSGTLDVPPSQDSEDDATMSEDDEHPTGYDTHYASLPSLAEQRIDLFKNNALSRGAIGLFFISSILQLVAAILVSTGRHKMMVEVEAGVMMGVATALASTFVGLAMFLLRTDRPGWISVVVVWGWFAILCTVSGALLVEVANVLG